MEIKKENTVQENVTLTISKKYKDNDLITFNSSVSILQQLLDLKVLLIDEYKDAVNIIANEHGLKLDSIFVSNQLDISLI